MSPVRADCPGCGAEIVFSHERSVVLVCAHCRSVVARAGLTLQDIGKVALLMETGASLRVGLEGWLRGQRFEITGRAQIRHGAGGVWDEWYAELDDGRVGWLAEAQGKFYLTFAHEPEQPLPPHDSLSPGANVVAVYGWTVGEVGEATLESAEGEIPYRLEPGRRFAYADLSGPAGEFATIDYSDAAPRLYVGREVTLADLGVEAQAVAARRKVAARELKCPECHGALELRAPDRTERVACPYCGALLDVSHGGLELLQTLGKAYQPVLPLGASARFGAHTFTIIGGLERSVTYEGTRYAWEELLLYEPSAGFRWLVCSDAHWSWGTPLSPGEARDRVTSAYWRGRTFKLYQSARVTVDRVLGELYWKVTVGETVQSSDFIRPPEMLAMETTEGEVSWTRLEYLDHREVARKFGVELPAPVTVAPNQPFRHAGVYRWWALFTAALMVAAVVVGGCGRTPLAPLDWSITLEPATEPVVFFSDPFPLEGGQRIEVSASSDLADNAWVYLVGDLVNEETGLVQELDLPIEYYHGVDGGESWSEGEPTAVALAECAAGRAVRAAPRGLAPARDPRRLSPRRGAPWVLPAVDLCVGIRPAVGDAAVRRPPSLLVREAPLAGQRPRAPLGAERVGRGRVMKLSPLVGTYVVLAGLVVGTYGSTQAIGWEWGTAPRTFVPADVRQAPGGYRSFHYWHRGYRGGK